jgi:hypothetical protein
VCNRITVYGNRKKIDGKTDDGGDKQDKVLCFPEGFVGEQNIHADIHNTA